MTVLRVADLELDLLSRRVRRGGREIELKTREFQILEFLMRNAGRVVTRTMLLESVWDFHFDPKTNVIDVHVSRLRQKIDKGEETRADPHRARSGLRAAGRLSVRRSIRTRLGGSRRRALVAGAAILVIGAVYWATVSGLRRDTEGAARDELDSLLGTWRSGGLDALVGEVRRRGADPASQGFAYLVAEQRSVRIAGNVRAWPEKVPEGAQRRPGRARGAALRRLARRAPTASNPCSSTAGARCWSAATRRAKRRSGARAPDDGARRARALARARDRRRARA